MSQATFNSPRPSKRCPAGVRNLLSARLAALQKHRLAVYSSIGLIILLLMAGVPLLAPLFGANPDTIDLYNRYGHEPEHPFGSDEPVATSSCG